MADVEVTTLEKVDPSSNSNKFYRAYHVSDSAGAVRTIVQWGSQRTSRSGGQSKVYTNGGEYTKRVNGKRGEGYTHVDNGRIQVPDSVVARLYGLSNGQEANGVTSVLEREYHANGVGTPQPKPRPKARHVCDECGAGYGSSTGLTAHKQKMHSEPVDPWTDPNQEVSALSKLADDALACVSLASTDPEKAIVEAAQIRARLEEERNIIRKVESYLSTVDMMVDED